MLESTLGERKVLTTLCCYSGTNKGLIYYTLLLLITLTVTHSIHSISNMEVLASNDRMSAITIFSLYLENQYVTRPSQ